MQYLAEYPKNSYLKDSNKYEKITHFSIMEDIIYKYAELPWAKKWHQPLSL